MENLFKVASIILSLSGNPSLAQETVSKSQKKVSTLLGAPTTPPFGWVQFCEQGRDIFLKNGDIPSAFHMYLPEEEKIRMCVSETLEPVKIILTEENWRHIVKINANVNNEVKGVSDQENHGVPELWGYPSDGKGDCEDYVLEKRKKLMSEGFPQQALLITVVRDLKGEGHAVLTIVTDHGDFILDNQVGKILAWDKTGYTYIKRQSQTNMMEWVSLGDMRTAVDQTGVKEKEGIKKKKTITKKK